MGRMWRKLLFILSAGIGIWVSVAAVAQNQREGARVPYDGADSMTGPMPIHVDETCRILPADDNPLGRKKPHPYRDSAVCALEGPAESTHWEEKIAGNMLQRTFVHVKERTFVLQDIADGPVMYIVQYDVPQGWFVDSDPQPWQIVGQTAYFHVYVKPGETIRLHVGVRREWPSKPKPI
jgi:hypothetical protein